MEKIKNKTKLALQVNSDCGKIKILINYIITIFLIKSYSIKTGKVSRGIAQFGGSDFIWGMFEWE
jgi:hypothetical protein